MALHRLDAYSRRPCAIATAVPRLRGAIRIDRGRRTVGVRYGVFAFSIGIKCAPAASTFIGIAVTDSCRLGATPGVYIARIVSVSRVEKWAEFRPGVITAMAVEVVFDFYVESVGKTQEEKRYERPHFGREMVKEMETERCLLVPL
jgi:hypothetical protein